jgi:hypothetical protein
MPQSAAVRAAHEDDLPLLRQEGNPRSHDFNSATLGVIGDLPEPCRSPTLERLGRVPNGRSACSLANPRRGYDAAVDREVDPVRSEVTSERQLRSIPSLDARGKSRPLRSGRRTLLIGPTRLRATDSASRIVSVQAADCAAESSSSMHAECPE